MNPVNIKLPHQLLPAHKRHILHILLRSPPNQSNSTYNRLRLESRLFVILDGCAVVSFR
jgi:hypothetical protein